MRECDCAEFVEKLFALLDSEVGGPEAEILRAHLGTCPDCTRVAEAESHVRDLLRRSCRERAPETLRVRVRTQFTVMRFESRPE